MVTFLFATSGNEVLGKTQGGRRISTHFIHSVPVVRRDPQQMRGESLLAVTLFLSRLGLVSVSYCCRFAASPEATKGGLGKADDYMRGKLSQKLYPLLYRDCYELTK